MATSAHAEHVPAPRAPIWEDFVDIFVSPASVFERRRDGRFGLALLILTIILGALTWVYMDAMAPALSRQFAAMADQIRQQNPNVTEEQLSAMRGMGATFGTIAAIVTIPIAVLLTGVVIWLLGKFFDSVATIAIGLMIATYAQFPRVLKSVVEIGQAMFMDPASLDSIYRPTLSPARFLDPDATSQMMLAIASRFDVFIIWMTVLIGIGIHVAGRVSRRSAAIIAFLIWLFAGLIAVAGAGQAG